MQKAGKTSILGPVVAGSTSTTMARHQAVERGAVCCHQQPTRCQPCLAPAKCVWEPSCQGGRGMRHSRVPCLRLASSRAAARGEVSAHREGCALSPIAMAELVLESQLGPGTG